MNAEIKAKRLQASIKSRQLTAFYRARTAQAMHKEGVGIGEIAKRLGVNPRTISKDLKKDLTLLINNPELTG